MMIRFLIPTFSWILLGFILTAPAIASPLSDAQSAYSAGNYAKAFEAYTKLANKNDAQSQLSLGVMYSLGQGVTQSHKIAAKWFQQSAKRGNVMAQNILGEMYDQGTGVPQDYKIAAKWYRLAAEQGDTHGQYNLGIMYARGLGMPLDYIRGYMWLSLSAKSKDELQLTAKQMTRNQIAEAKTLAMQCSAKKFKGC